MNFKIKTIKTHYEGRAFSVEKVDMLLPDGRETTYDLVRHNDSVSIVPVDGNGCILFVSQYRLGAEDQLLELPAGVDEDGESPEASAAREIREETGMAAGKLTRLGEYYLAPGYSSELMYAFLATDLTPAPLQSDPDEFLQVKAIPIDQAYAMARRGEIRDSKSLAALLLAEPYIRP